MSVSTTARPPVSLLPGAFIRVRRDHENPFRRGLDAMVIRADNQEGTYGLVFGWDRHNRWQQADGRHDITGSVGTELWLADELDWESVAP